MITLLAFLCLFLMIAALLFYALDLSPLQSSFKSILKIVLIAVGGIVLVERVLPGLR